MWIFGGAKTKARGIAGEHITNHCTHCGRDTDHRPVTIKDRFHLFFVDLGSVDSIGYACVTCGEIVEADKLTSAPRLTVEEFNRASPPTSGASAARTIATISASLPEVRNPDAITAPRTPRRSVDNARIEKELAALKRKK